MKVTRLGYEYGMWLVSGLSIVSAKVQTTLLAVAVLRLRWATERNDVLRRSG